MDNSAHSEFMKPELLASAKHGDAEAQLALAKFFLNNTSSDRRHALQWLVRSSRLGNREAITLLRQMLISQVEPDDRNSEGASSEFRDFDRAKNGAEYREVEIDLLVIDLLGRIKRWKKEIHAYGGEMRGTLGNGISLSCIRRFDILMRASLFRLLQLLGGENTKSLEDISKGKPLERLTFGECIGLLRQFDGDLTKGFRRRWPEFNLKGRLVGKSLGALLNFHSKDRNQIVHPKLVQQRDLDDETWERMNSVRARASELLYSNTEMGSEGLTPFLENVEKVCQSDFMLAVVVASGASDLDEDAIFLLHESDI